MALVQAAKSAGTVTVEATAPGLAPATATLACLPVALRPQVAVWERPVPAGAGITGLWRPVAGPAAGMLAAFLGSPRVFTLVQDGGKLTGTVEGSGGFFGGDDQPVPIAEGVVDGDRVAFKSGINAFEGRVAGDRIELQRSVRLPFGAPQAPGGGSRPAGHRARAGWHRPVDRLRRPVRAQPSPGARSARSAERPADHRSIAHPHHKTGRRSKNMNKHLTIVADIKAKSDRIDLVKAELLKLIAMTRAEKGCINYDLHQDNEDPAHFLFYENWESRELWQAHMGNQHLKDYMAATDGAVAEFTLSEMTQVG